MHIKVINHVLNLAELQEKLDSTVFEQIDTTQNWKVALNNLSSLHDQIVQYFQDTLQHLDGALPKSNSYWTLFLNSASKVVYFYHVAKQHEAQTIPPELAEQLKQGYRLAGKLLPNNLSEDNEELVIEIEKSLQQLDVGATLEKTANQVAESLMAFRDYTQAIVK